MNVISLVAGGWSVKEVDLSLIPGYVIAVNDSMRYLPRVDEIISMDRLWSENRWGDLIEKGIHSHLRASAVQNLPFEEFAWCYVFSCNNETGEFAKQGKVNGASLALNGRNSAYCGLNRAYHLAPKQLFLFGFDLQRGPRGEAHWYPPYEWASLGSTSRGKFAEWEKDFAIAAKLFKEIGTQVINVSSRSLIRDFETAGPQDFR